MYDVYIIYSIYIYIAYSIQYKKYVYIIQYVGDGG